MMQEKSKSFNLQAFLELLSCLSFAGIVFYLLKSGKYLNYVTPRMKPYFYFTLILMLIWAFTGVSRLFQPQYQIRLSHCFVLLIPVLFLFIPHSTINTADFVRKYSVSQIQENLTGKPRPGGQGNLSPVPDDSSANETTAQSQAAPENADQESTLAASPEEESTAPLKEFSDVLPGLDKELKTITVSNDDFGFWVSEINMNPQKYADYKIKMTGFVYIDPDTFQKDEFMASRLLMTCCVADLSPVGLICKYDNTSQLKTNSWVTVEGVLFASEYEYNGQTYYTPELTVTEMLPAKEVTGYVYAY